MDDLTDILAVYAAVVSTAALVWSIVSWLFNWVLTGARIKIDVLAGATNGVQYATVPIVRGQFVAPRVHGPGMALPTEMVFVTIRNRGRLAATIERVLFKTDTDEGYGSIGGPDKGPRFPVTVEPGGSATLGYDWAAMEEFAELVRSRHGSDVVPIMAIADLGSGKSIKGRPTILATREGTPRPHA